MRGEVLESGSSPERLELPVGHSRKPGNLLRASLAGNGFVISLLFAVSLAFLFPGPGAKGSWMHPELVNNAGVALILFIQGLSMAVEQMKVGARNWRLHMIVQGFTFIVFPLVGVLFYAITHFVWPTESTALRDGFLYLCVLPSTVSTSVVLTTLAKGNTAGAIFNAALSNIGGVLFTPLLVRLLMQASGQTGYFGSVLLKITLLTLVPFLIGLSIRPLVRGWVGATRRWLTILSNLVILFIVYTAFCDSVVGKLWQEYGVGLTVQVLAGVVVLFTAVSLLVYGVSKAVGLARDDSIAAFFCSVKKTLAMGVPLAQLIFGAKANLGLILLPIMFYHPFQLFVCGVLATRFANQKQVEDDGNRLLSRPEVTVSSGMVR